MILGPLNHFFTPCMYLIRVAFAFIAYLIYFKKSFLGTPSVSLRGGPLLASELCAFISKKEGHLFQSFFCMTLEMLSGVCIAFEFFCVLRMFGGVFGSASRVVAPGMWLEPSSPLYILSSRTPGRFPFLSCPA